MAPKRSQPFSCRFKNGTQRPDWSRVCGRARRLTGRARALFDRRHRLASRPCDSASWLNAVEGFFATLTKRRLKRGVFRSVADLQAAINRFLEEHNQQSKAFTWTANPDEIIAAVRRGHQVLDSIH